MTVDFYGNALLESVTSYEQAVNVYSKLSTMAKDSDSVVRFTLSPLSDYCDKTAQILNDISADNLNYVSRPN